MTIKRYKKKGFTLVEIMIVVAIIGILASIAIPTYNKLRIDARASVCKANLKQIESAIDQWAFENSITSEDVSLESYEDEIYSYFAFGEPSCPSGGENVFGSMGDSSRVTCSSGLEGHAYP
ncbi:MAG: prepilin-type N-terminal cleavage/methylation domain-containing protein [Candidatus Omnitrophica bacterium]|nr:prepilin-type N-terminal cleavage/methylation domain-containing protein [Candidatus Omnitrophota bacterium]